ncbi:MAG TPA: cytochrome c [Woeseiaceae bacterium]|nr:cytochrome c [Woeseiaceae bacterium]
MRIEVYLDQDDAPFQTLVPPETFHLDTESMADGPHQLLFRAIDDGNGVSERRMSFNVQNGPAIAVHGIVDGETLHGQVGVLANAYGARAGDEFEPRRMETPVPVPTWAWVLFLAVLAWGAGYLSFELSNHIESVIPQGASMERAGTPQASDESPESGSDMSQAWAVLGEQVYGVNCASCHQATGAGLPSVFPPLAQNAVVINADPAEHINAIVHGVSGKVIDGIEYMAPMPPFGGILSDAEIAAVVNHERTHWGNNAPTITADDVAEHR